MDDFTMAVEDLAPVAGTLLDRPIWAALSSLQNDIAIGTDRARAYPAEIGPLAAVCNDTPEALADLARLVAARQTLVLLQAGKPPVPPGCRVEMTADAVQMIATGSGELPDPGSDSGEIVALGEDDAAEMLALAKLTAPGPFAARTHTLGQFYGIRIDGRLAAMAGQRMRFAGYGEMSGVCTHPDFRGLGLAMRLSAKVINIIRARGEQPFLHVRSQNTNAIRVYERLGFTIRQAFTVMQLVPENRQGGAEAPPW